MPSTLPEDPGGPSEPTTAVDASSTAENTPPAARDEGDETPPAQAGEPAEQKTKPISPEAKEELFAHFEGPPTWAYSRKLPRGEDNLDDTLKRILKKYGLKKSQIARQLRNFKDVHYKHTQVEIILGEGELAAMLADGLALEEGEFVANFLERLFDPSLQVASSKDFVNMSQVMNHVESPERDFVSKLSTQPKHACFELLLGLIEKWVNIASECFPKTAAGLAPAEVMFQQKKLLCKRGFVEDWMERTPDGLDEAAFGCIGRYLFNVMFMEWSLTSADGERPPVEFPTSNLVSKYARAVIYYVAGWTLASSLKALTVKLEDRTKYREFAQDALS